MDLEKWLKKLFAKKHCEHKNQSDIIYSPDKSVSHKICKDCGVCLDVRIKYKPRSTNGKRQ